MIQCCGEDMLTSNGWHHCRQCEKRLIEVQHDKEQRVLASMLVEYVNDSDIGWTTLQRIIHELWKQGYYEGYEPNVPDQWNTSLDA